MLIRSQYTSEIEDCNQPWTFKPNSIDYVHIKYLVGSIPDWYELFKQAYIVCTPGGYLESVEGTSVFESDDGTLGEAMAQWGEIFVEGGKKIGNTFTVYGEGIQRKAMEQAGFINIQEQEFKVSHLGEMESSRLAGQLFVVI